MSDSELTELSRRGQLYLSLREMQTIRDHFAEREARSDRRRAGNDRPDLERTLLAQDARRPHPLSRRIARAAVRQPAQGDDLRRHADDPRTARQGRLVRQRLQGQRRRRQIRRRELRLLQGRDAQPSFGTRTLRRSEHGAGRRDPRSAGHGARCAARLQHRRLLLRSARYAVRIAAAGRAASANGREGSRFRRPRLRQPDGHSDGQRRDLLRSAIPRQSARLLRQRGDDSGRQSRKADATRRLDRGRRRSHRPRRHSRGHVFLRPN